MSRWRSIALGVGIAAVCALAYTAVKLDWFAQPAAQSQFQKDTASLNLAMPISGVQTNADGTIRYLYDDFSTYGEHSRLIDGFTATNQGLVNAIDPRLDSQAYEGDTSLRVTTQTGPENFTSIDRQLSTPVDLTRWQDKGYASLWLKTPGAKGISGVSLQLSDATGAYREYSTLPNLQTDYPDIFNKNDPFVDLAYPEATHSAEWTDFSLKAGWNYLPWRMDKGHYQDHGTPDLSKITTYKIVFHTTQAAHGQQWLVDNLRVQDGLQKASNAVNGSWYPPLGMPQYGVYDIDTSNDASVLNLQNVRQTQYPSNGDHGRMLTKNGTPLNFAMRTRFEVKRLGEPSGNLTNTWLRIFYDFDPEYDPGHDWFGSYFSFDYKKLGLISVIPVERFAVQTQEPLESQKDTAFRTGFELKANTLYEYNLTVNGQDTQVVIYEVRGGALYEKAKVHYTFERQRGSKRYPLGIEITGNIKATIHEVEVAQL